MSDKKLDASKFPWLQSDGKKGAEKPPMDNVSKLEEIGQTKYVVPNGLITFGWKARSYPDHKGIDIIPKRTGSAPTGTPIYSLLAGFVVTSVDIFPNNQSIYNDNPKDMSKAFGNYVVVLSSGGIYAYYCHLYSVEVEKYTRIKRGELIGTMGDTGNSAGDHLHFELRRRSMSPASAFDPTPYFGYEVCNNPPQRRTGRQSR